MPLPTDYVYSVFEWLSKGYLSQVYFVYDAPLDRQEEVRKVAFSIDISLFRDDIHSKVSVLLVTKDNAKDKIFEELKRLGSPTT